MGGDEAGRRAHLDRRSRIRTRVALSRTPADDERLRAVFGAYQRLTRGRCFW